MLAKYNGKCDISGEEIKAGVTEIEKYRGLVWVKAEYASDEVVAEYVKNLVAGYEDARIVKTALGYFNSKPSIKNLKDLRAAVRQAKIWEYMNNNPGSHITEAEAAVR